MKEYSNYIVNGIQPKSLESFIVANPHHIANQIPGFKRGKYDVVVTMYARPGTMEALVRDGAVSRDPVHGAAPLLVARGLGGLPTIQPGNTQQVHVKAEKGSVTFGLRKGVDGSAAMYNSHVDHFDVATLEDFVRRYGEY